MANLQNISESIEDISSLRESALHRYCCTLNIPSVDVHPRIVAPLPVIVDDHYDNVTSRPVGVTGHSIRAHYFRERVTLHCGDVKLHPDDARLLPLSVGLLPLRVE